MGAVSVAVLSCGVMDAEPLASRASPVHPAPLKHPSGPRAVLVQGRHILDWNKALVPPRGAVPGGLGFGNAAVSSVPAVADGSLVQKGKH